MRTIKGRIIEIGDDSLVLLTSQGEFLERPLPPHHIQVGDELTLPVPGVIQVFNKFVPYAAAAALFVFLLLQSVMTMATPAFYIHLDINPSVELGISKNLRVVEATGLNADGKKVLDKVSIIDQSIETAVKLLVATADEMNYIAPDKENTVLVSVVSLEDDNQEKENRLTDEIRDAVSQQLEKGKSKVTLGFAVADKQKRQEALKKHSSINKMFKNQDAKGQKKIPDNFKIFKVVPHFDRNNESYKNQNQNNRNWKNSDKNSDKNSSWKNGNSGWGQKKAKDKDDEEDDDKDYDDDSRIYRNAREKLKEAWKNLQFNENNKNRYKDDEDSDKHSYNNDSSRDGKSWNNSSQNEEDSKTKKNRRGRPRFQKSQDKDSGDERKEENRKKRRR